MLLGLLPFAVQPELRVVLPNDPQTVLNVKRDLGAKGDGRTDDTEALQKALDISSGIDARQTKLLFIPNGTYRVTKSLIVKNPIGPWVMGETRSGVVIKLDDGVQGVTAVLRTHPREQGPTSADWFMRNFRNLTIDVGNNPGTDGIRYYSTNTGIIQNVTVRGNGKIGINGGFLDQSGPKLIQDVLIEGFETGILSHWVWGTTMSRVTIRNASKVGVSVEGHAVGIEDLRTENVPQPLRVQLPNDWGHWAGVASVIGADFRGKSTGPAIFNQGILYARNVRTQGYGSAIQSTSPAGNVAGAVVNEYSSNPLKTIFSSSEPYRPLPIKAEPKVRWETNPANWLCANDFGVTVGDNTDDTAAIQRAMDAAAQQGKTVVYFRGTGGPDPNYVLMEGRVKIRGKVRMIMGLGWGRLLGKGGFVMDDQSQPLVLIRNLDAFGGPPIEIENASAKGTLVVESSGVRVVGSGAGDIFMTDCPSLVDLRKPGQRLWARHFNPEGDSATGLARNNGGSIWALGVKSEGKGVRFATLNGGRTEVHGMFMYGPGMDAQDKRPMFLVENGSLMVTGLREIVFGGNAYPMKLSATRGSEKVDLDAEKEPGWIGWASLRVNAK